jgi:MerR family transcriptional regulator/heat shock protein HspR
LGEAVELTERVGSHQHDPYLLVVGSSLWTRRYLYRSRILLDKSRLNEYSSAEEGSVEEDAVARSRDAAVYVMSVAADLAGLHPQTLRLYERRGLVEPARTGGGNRRYSEADLDQLRRIATLTEAGVNIEGVRRVLELEAEVARLTRALEQARRAAKAVSIRSALKR